jgi:hypothetical protein
MTLTRQSLSRPIRPLLLSLCAAVTLSTLPGCALLSSGGGAEIRLEPTGRYIVYHQEFAAAWCQLNPDGEYDMVLVDQPRPTADDRGQPLPPATATNPLQVMHVHVAWRPSSGMRPNYPAATNASINWYVIDNHDPHNPQYVHYQGAGLVRVDAGDAATTFDIQPTLISPRHQNGEIHDPIGPARLSGKIKAQNRPQKTADVLSSLDQMFRLAQGDSGQPPATEPSGTPRPQPDQPVVP